MKVMQRSFLVFYLSSYDGCKLLTSSWTELLGKSILLYLSEGSLRLVPTFLGDFERRHPSGAAMVVEAKGDEPFLLFAWTADSSPGRACEFVSPLVNFPGAVQLNFVVDFATYPVCCCWMGS